jgi:hypothetical protein
LLEEYRKAGLYKDLAEKLIQLHREDEALKVATARLIDSTEVTHFADQLLKSGKAWQEPAFAFVEMRMKEAESAAREKPRDFATANKVDTYRRWLGEKYSTYGKAISLPVSRSTRRLMDYTKTAPAQNIGAARKLERAHQYLSE